MHGDMFLKLKSARGGDVKGEANDSVHGGEIDVLSFSWGMKGASMGAAGTASRSTMDSLHITKEVDCASTALMSVLRTNDVVKEAVLSVRKAGGGPPLDFLTITIGEGRISGYELVTDAQKQNRLLEHITISFQKIEVAYVGQNKTGGPTGTTMFEAETAD